MMLRDTSELRQPLAKEAMTVLAAVHASIADHVRVVVRDRQMSVNTVVLVDIIVDRVVVGTENHRLIASIGHLFVDVLEILSNQKFNSSVGATDECHDRRFVRLEASSPLFLSPRLRGLSSSFSTPFSPAVT